MRDHNAASVLKNRTNKARIIIPYYGAWPSYINLFLSSVKNVANTLDYLIITDLPNSQFEYISNLQFLNLSFDELKELIVEKTKTHICLEEPYKLCDFKPAYGDIFEEYLKEYDFWGIGDLDIILGEANDSLPFNWFSYDVISMRKEWVTGSLCLLRNTTLINKLYTRSNNWQSTFQCESFQGFDECYKLFGELVKNPESIFSIDPDQSFTFLVKQAEKNGELKLWANKIIKESIPKGDYVHICRGEISDANHIRYLHYHLITEKKSPYFFFPNWETIPEEYFITRFGFFTKNQFESNLRLWREGQRKIMGTFRHLIALSNRIIIKMKRKFSIVGL